jgi:hypothetical protein
MKKFLMAGFAAVACIVGITGPSFSQNASNADYADTKIVSDLQKPSVISYTAVNLKAMRDFRNTYTNVNDEVWIKSKNGYIALFTSDDTRFKVEYDNLGDWYATEKAYAENKLPRDIRAIVKRTYFDYTINWITEITVPEDFTGPAYIIQIQDEKGYRSICVHEGEMRTLEEFSKSRK